MPEEKGASLLEKRINNFNQALADMKEATSEAHSVLKQLRQERKTIEELMKGAEIRRMVETRVDEVVKGELDEIGPGIREQTSRIYSQVSKEVDRLINLSLGKEHSLGRDSEDLRPLLAAKFREWINELIREEGRLPDV
jgi:hypothetical protein